MTKNNSHICSPTVTFFRQNKLLFLIVFCFCCNVSFKNSVNLAVIMRKPKILIWQKITLSFASSLWHFFVKKFVQLLFFDIFFVFAVGLFKQWIKILSSNWLEFLWRIKRIFEINLIPNSIFRHSLVINGKQVIKGCSTNFLSYV